jgi:hypothetical protein
MITWLSYENQILTLVVSIPKKLTREYAEMIFVTANVESASNGQNSMEEYLYTVSNGLHVLFESDDRDEISEWLEKSWDGQLIFIEKNETRNERDRED